MSRIEDLDRIRTALSAAAEALRPHRSGAVAFEHKSPGDPVTEADRAVDATLRAVLPRDGEGWLSEESVDDSRRLACERVWVVDPIDGTREFVEGIPEWVVSVGLVEGGRAVAGGILNPSTGELFVGGRGVGVTLGGQPVRASAINELRNADVVVSLSEWRRGEWRGLDDAPFRARPVGSVAYKLALVAAGLAEATWSPHPRHEWDVAAGVALVLAAGGEVFTREGDEPRFNRPDPRGLRIAACGGGLGAEVRAWLDSRGGAA